MKVLLATALLMVVPTQAPMQRRGHLGSGNGHQAAAAAALLRPLRRPLRQPLRSRRVTHSRAARLLSVTGASGC